MRPRYTSPDEAEVDRLGEDLVAWATEENTKPKDKRTAWSFWYALKHGMLRNEFKALVQLGQFRPYYEIARAAMAQKIHNDELEKGMAHRYIRLYDRDLREEEDEDKAYEAKLRLIKEDKDKDEKKEIVQKEAQHFSNAILKALDDAVKKQK